VNVPPKTFFLTPVIDIIPLIYSQTKRFRPEK
jgi:hypothetical protein